LPVVIQRLRVAQIIFDLLFQLRLRHHCIERWFRLGIFPAVAGPDAMTPVNLFNCPLVSYSLCKRQSRDCGIGGLRFRFRTKRRHHQSSGQQHKQVKRASKKMRSSWGGNSLFHSYASKTSTGNRRRAPPYSKRVKDVENFLAADAPHFALSAV
jgi:hypothetical protein